MKLSMNWLKDYVKEDFDPKAYSDKLTMTGSKVEGYECPADEIKNVVVGKLITVEKHPDSDHLLICMVDIGESEPVQIVTGAQNVKPGELVPAALHDSYLPGGVHIKAGKLRGVPSNGMLCSLGELGLDKHDFPYAEEDGIFLLQEDCKPGDDICKVLGLDDVTVEFEITSNRPDCLSMIGLARETAASFDTDVTIPTPVVKETDNGKTINDYISVEVLDSKLCPRYTARVVENVKIEPSPKWLRSRLRACGIRPINNIVDITNYVCLEYGQPMHAFDASFLGGSKIVVRHAEKDEKITTLDSIERQLSEEMLVIADADKAVAVAGVMGGENSEINDNTKTIVFESANFNGPSVRLTAKAIGLRTEASGRYEKGLDPENTLPAIERACELIEMLGAGEVVKGIIDVYPEKPQKRAIPFDADKINAFLGTDVAEEEMKAIFKKLDIELVDGVLYPPSYRADLECMQDIAEEVIRIHGYDLIPTTNFKAEALVGRRNAKQNSLKLIDELLIGEGYYEVQTFSFISPKYYDNICMPSDSPLRKSVVISNPLGEDTSIMRTTAVPSVLEVLSTNRRYRNKNARIYENAKVYITKEGEDQPDERMSTVIAAYGDVDFYDMKGVCENILDLLGIKAYDFVPNTEAPAFHPGRCASVLSRDGERLIVFGQLHPAVQENYGLDIESYVIVCDTELMMTMQNFDKHYKALPKFPSSERDLAFVCDKALTSGEIKKAIKKYGGKLLESVEVFDIFEDEEKVGAGKKSMAYNLVLRSPEKTLSVEECDKAVAKILKGLEFDLGITLRG
ncbi:MAG: phenylalanine--tRNA ligase subunit beta [Ruminococcaceae bacterium]|nr:phenylalanine--tRNA ligase subunit beta [Oscillospiraceae bacterium]